MKKLFLVACLIIFPKVAFLQNLQIIEATHSTVQYYILSLPSSECINCKAIASEILKYFEKHKKKDSLVLLTNNDAGAYYIDNNPNINKKYKITVSKSLTTLLSPEARATLCFRGVDSIAIIKVADKLPSELFNILDNSSIAKTISSKLSPNRTDSIKLKYNIFESYANSIIPTQEENILLFSKKDNAGCFLLPDTRDSITPLIQPKISNDKYDSLINVFKPQAYPNVSQVKTRQICTRTGISIARIFQLIQSEKHGYAYFNLYTAYEKLISKDSVNIRLNYNIGVGKTDKILSSSPLDIGSYSMIMPIDNLSYKGVEYQPTTIAPVIVVDKDYIYLPYSPLGGDQKTIDSMFFLAKFKFSDKKNITPLSLYRYRYCSFTEECIARGKEGSLPIVLNKVRNIFDYGIDKKPIHLNLIRLPINTGDTISFVYDYVPIENDKIKIVAYTKGGMTIVAIINRKAVEEIKVLDIPEAPIACAFLKENHLISINKKNKQLVTNQFTNIFSKSESVSH